MKTLLLNLLLWTVVTFILFLLGGFVTMTFHATNTGLGLFVFGTIAWTLFLLRGVIKQAVRG